MLRSVLRNVQYYLLFFSVLLVLLAFQRLQWYDQLIPHNPYAFLNDHPFHHHGRGAYTDGETSPDNAGRVYYGGDESKEIGLFKIRLGLFKFILPTFAKDSISWERTNELTSLMTVPRPPNEQRKSAEKKLYLRLKAQKQLLDANLSYVGGEVEDVKSSVAYVVVLPDISELENENSITESYAQRANVFSHSIKRAHERSPYEYKLYAIVLSDASDAVSDDRKKVYASLEQSEFIIIELPSKNTEGDTSSHEEEKEVLDFSTVLDILKQHDIVVHTSVNSFLLNPMDDLFAALMKGGVHENNNDIDKVVGVKGREVGEGGELKFAPTQVESFALDSSDSATGDLFIFRSDAIQASGVYTKRLECIYFQSKGDDHTSLQVKKDDSTNHPSIQVARKNQQTSINQDDLSNPCITTEQPENSSLLLDKCVYNVGGDSTIDCSDMSNVKDIARVAHFPEGATSVSGIQDASKNSCSGPWEYPTVEDCSKNNSDRQGDVCAWLCVEWFNFGKTQ